MAHRSLQSVIDNRKRRRDLVRRYKASVGCNRCGESDPRCLELHHTDPTTKHAYLATRFNYEKQTSWRLGWQSMSYAAIVEEVAKCEVLCSNCHRKEELEEFEAFPPPAQGWAKFRAAEKALGLAD